MQLLGNGDNQRCSEAGTALSRRRGDEIEASMYVSMAGGTSQRTRLPKSAVQGSINRDVTEDHHRDAPSRQGQPLH